jgi:hypothetical protein
MLPTALGASLSVASVLLAKALYGASLAEVVPFLGLSNVMVALSSPLLLDEQVTIAAFAGAMIATIGIWFTTASCVPDPARFRVRRPRARPAILGTLVAALWAADGQVLRAAAEQASCMAKFAYASQTP